MGVKMTKICEKGAVASASHKNYGCTSTIELNRSFTSIFLPKKKTNRKTEKKLLLRVHLFVIKKSTGNTFRNTKKHK